MKTKKKIEKKLLKLNKENNYIIASLKLGDITEKSEGTGKTLLDAIVNALKGFKPAKFHTTKGEFTITSEDKTSKPVPMNFWQMKKLFTAGGMTSNIHRLVLAKRLLYFL